jgi:pyruvate, orthophosphate dikinase
MLCVARTAEQREKALATMEPYQTEDFVGIFEAMGGRHVTVRLLDPPLHEFLPHGDKESKAVAEALGITVKDIEAAAEELKEFNPMMGHRGCRLDVTYPEIGAMQARAIINAAIKVNKAHPKWKFVPEIMIPLVGEPKELDYVANVVKAEADKIISEAKVKMEYKVGTMIEIPRAALLADELAKTAEFFSFGTNDLTQMTFGFSRDDAGKFLPDYYGKHIYESDPFAHVDTQGVGQLVKMAADKGRLTRKDIHLGVCGEHGGDPASIEFFNAVGLDYVSCSPYRVPIARLAAAQATIKLDRAKVAEKAANKKVAKKAGKKVTKKVTTKPVAAKKDVTKKVVAKVQPKKDTTKKVVTKKSVSKKTTKKVSKKK